MTLEEAQRYLETDELPEHDYVGSTRATPGEIPERCAPVTSGVAAIKNTRAVAELAVTSMTFVCKKARVTVTVRRDVLGKAEREVRRGRAKSVSAWVDAAMEEKARREEARRYAATIVTSDPEDLRKIRGRADLASGRSWQCAVRPPR